MTAGWNCLLLACYGWDKNPLGVDWSKVIKICSLISYLVLEAICSNVLLRNSFCLVKNLSIAVRFCRSIYISSLIFNSSNKILTFVIVSVSPDRFKPS